MGTLLSKPRDSIRYEKGMEKNNAYPYVVGSMQGWRRFMEDAHVINCNFPNPLLDQFQLFGVFDGHSGNEVAQYCATFIVPFLQEILLKAYREHPQTTIPPEEDSRGAASINSSPHSTAPASMETIQSPPSSISSHSSSSNRSDVFDRLDYGKILRELFSKLDLFLFTQIGQLQLKRIIDKEEKDIELNTKVDKLSRFLKQHMKRKKRKSVAVDRSLALGPQMVDQPPRKHSDSSPSPPNTVHQMPARSSVVDPFGCRFHRESMENATNERYPKHQRRQRSLTVDGNVMLEIGQSRFDEQISDNTIDSLHNNASFHSSKHFPPKKPAEVSLSHQDFSVCSISSSPECPIDINSKIPPSLPSIHRNQELASSTPSIYSLSNSSKMSGRGTFASRASHAFKIHSTAGATANVVLMYQKHLFVANAGDSRCVLSQQGQAVELSMDHKPEDPTESERIEMAGGYVKNGRVNGCLNLSRAIGDIDFKLNKSLPLTRQMISSEPGIQHHLLQDERDEFLLIACDGIWECFSSQEIVQFIHHRLYHLHLSAQEIIQQLFQACLSPTKEGHAGSSLGLDNMTAILLVLQPSLPTSNCSVPSSPDLQS